MAIYSPRLISRMADDLIEAVIGGSTLYSKPQNSKTEHVAAAAWRTPEGTIYAGDDHFDAAYAAIEAGDKKAAGVVGKDGFHEFFFDLGWESGFITDKDRFVSREEAVALARKNKQLTSKKPSDWLDSTDLMSRAQPKA